MVKKSTEIAPISFARAREASAACAMLARGDNSMSLTLSRDDEPSQRSLRSVTRTSLRVALYLALGALTLSPLLRVQVPPLVDFPSHLARVLIFVHSAEIPALASNYTIHWRLLPDLAMHL